MSRNRRVVASLTIAAILGTLAGCGVYGRPKRPAPTETAARPAVAVEMPRATSS